jgi:vacuolar-type H+-ATPase subunit I/STV1
VDITKRFWVTLSFLVIWAVLTVLAVTWGTRFDWPDNVHIDYGFPLVWATQTLSTIVGPVNLWSVDVTALIMDLALWLGIMLVVASIMLYFFNRKVSDGEKE